MGRMKDIYTELQEKGIDPYNLTEEETKKYIFLHGLNPDLRDQLLKEQVKWDHEERKAAYRQKNYGPVSKLGEIQDLPETIKEKIRNSSPNHEFEYAVQQKFQHAKHVLLTKHKDYGPKNISQSPGGPLNGLRVRMHDKVARINHLIDTGAKPENESLKDSFVDLANYAIIALLVLDNEWPE